MHSRPLSEPVFFPREIFADRHDAGRRLARVLSERRFEDAVAVGLARGGVVVAHEVARDLGVPLDVLAVRKVGHPWQPEYAIGAVTPSGGVYLRPHEDLTDRQVQDAVSAAQARADGLHRRLHERFAPAAVAGRTALLVDDGLATGATMIAAARWAGGADAARTVVAVPVGARETIELLEREADEVVCVEVPAFFGAVGFWYRDFGQVSDEEVIALLRAARRNGVRRSEAAIRLPEGELHADLAVPESPLGWVAFAHGSGSSRRSPRNVEVATDLNGAGIATMLFDLLTPAEELSRANVFDIDLLAQRLELGLEWLLRRPEYAGLPVGLFGASTGAAAALLAAARARDVVAAVVSRGGRPDLADEALALVRAPTLLIVGAADTGVLALNERAATQLTCEQQLAVVPGAAHLFEEPGALEQVAALARNWFLRHFERPAPEPRRGL